MIPSSIRNIDNISFTSFNAAKERWMNGLRLDLLSCSWLLDNSAVTGALVNNINIWCFQSKNPAFIWEKGRRCSYFHASADGAFLRSAENFIDFFIFLLYVPTLRFSCRDHALMDAARKASVWTNFLSNSSVSLGPVRKVYSVRAICSNQWNHFDI